MPIFPAIRSQQRIQAAFDHQRARDEIGHRIHLAFALAWCFLLAAPTTVVEIAVAPLYVFGLWRVLNVRRTWPAALLSPQFLLLAAWGLWGCVTLIWSPDRYHGMAELNRLRFALVIWMLWPVMDRRAWLLAALSGGFLLGNLSQAVHLLAHYAHLSWPDFGREPDRYSAWWDPVVGGSLLCGALGVHLAFAVRSGPARRPGTIGALITMLGILATGTRGAWIAGAILCAAAAIISAVAALRRRVRPWGAWAALVPCALFLAAAITIAPSLARRAEDARRDIAAAVERGDFSGYTATRLFLWQQAARAVAASPIGGVGIGGFRHWLEPAVAALPREHRPRSHAHAHSTPLHVAATTGLVGLGLAIAWLAACLRGSLRREPDGSRDPTALAAGAGLVGLLLAGLFDPVHVNAQTAALLYTLAAFTITPRPSPARPRRPGAV
ncbi:MAG: O-antigen ligase family protein [Phycisphaerales bacterium]|nr:O-antigen ligase family protein [Phycisphaerales bacterium]